MPKAEFPSQIFGAPSQQSSRSPYLAAGEQLSFHIDLIGFHGMKRIVRYFKRAIVCAIRRQRMSSTTFQVTSSQIYRRLGCPDHHGQ